MRAVVIRCDGSVEERDLSSLAEMQEVVGGYIEPCGLSDGSDMYINEEGRLIPLDYNPVATDVAGLGGRMDLLLHGVLGDVFILGPVDSRGETTDVTDLAISWVERVTSE